MPSFLLLKMFIPYRTVTIERVYEAASLDELWRTIWADDGQFFRMICPGGVPLQTIYPQADPLTVGDWEEGQREDEEYDPSRPAMVRWLEQGRRVYPPTSDGIHRLRHDQGRHSRALVAYTIVDDAFIFRKLYEPYWSSDN